MPGIARVGDVGQGICYHHKTPTPYTVVFTTGAESVFVNGLSACSTVTVGVASCGHPTIVLSGSPDVFEENQGAHRVGDVGQNGGPYIVLSGSDDVLSNS